MITVQCDHCKEDRNEDILELQIGLGRRTYLNDCNVEFLPPADSYRYHLHLSCALDLEVLIKRYMNREVK